MRKTCFAHFAAAVLAVGIFTAALAPRAAAEDKNIIQLQQAVSLLLNRVADLQKDFNTSVGMLQGLVSQNTDTVNKLSSTLASIQSSLNGGQVVASQQQADIAKQFQSLNDTIADLQAHLAKMDSTLQQIHQMQQTIPAPVAAPPGGGGAQPNGAPAVPGDPSAAANGTANTAAPAGVAPAGPTPALVAYQTALTDFESKSPAAQRELAAFLRNFPNDPQVPDAAFYLGSLLMDKQQYNEAINYFNQIIVQYSDNEKAPLAELNKGVSLARMGSKSEALAELRAVAKNYPGTSAARQAEEAINRLKKP